MRNASQNLIIVEDDPLIAMMIDAEVRDLGWTVQGIARTEQAAYDLLQSANPDLALLDINLGSSTSLAIATQCQERGTAVLFLSGYAASELPARCASAPILSKPFSSADLEQSINRALSLQSQ